MQERVQGYVGNNIGYFKCKCGEEKFTVWNAMYDERGVIEYEFGCKCGKRYNFHYGDIEEQK